MFGKVLIANRGEISVRISHACRKLGIASVAVYSEADAASLHVREADEAYPIGGTPAPESYLNVENLVAAIRESGADAVHPGYGFLSESAAFARAVEGAGAVWIGPTPEAMEAMGLKVRAKELARRANVPTVPGYDGEDQAEERLSEEAQKIGFPVLVKASAGGGGRGMREVRRPEDLLEALRGAKREALSAFGDGAVFLEKLVERPRHVEVQVVGDSFGSVVHLYERECSIQRRHQKVVEEAPSPALDPALRERICAAAVRLAREAGYTNAGTVEFLLEGGEAGEEFYFLEMNARLQVEHPVTEKVTGVDLVELQLAVAAGERLPVRQEEVLLSGSAIEARIYAEDKNGLPAGGRLLAFDPPEGVGVRNDPGVETGDEVSLAYDPMISKLIVNAPNREAAVRKLACALDSFTVRGVPMNLPLLRQISRNRTFADGKTTTDFLESEGLLKPPGEANLPGEVLALAAVAQAQAIRRTPEPFTAGGWRALGQARLSYGQGEGRRTVEVARREGFWEARADGETYRAEVLSKSEEKVYLLLEGKPARVEVREGLVEVQSGGESFEVWVEEPPEVDEAAGGAVASSGSLVAPMPGTVVKVMVEEGEEVEEGRLLLVLEAMKMEQPVSAPRAGVVRALPFGEGDLVGGGDVLAELE